MAQVDRGEGILYVFGIVKYKDIFGGKHETRYAIASNRDPRWVILLGKIFMSTVLSPTSG
jgi:hypothetical protein